MKILFILLLAYIYYHFRKRVPILMYHRIATVKGDRNSLPVEKFEEQMQYLEEKGFHSITMEQLESHILAMDRLYRINRLYLLLMTDIKIM